MKMHFVFTVCLSMMVWSAVVTADDSDPAAAERLMSGQLDALQKGDYSRFVSQGNQAFKTLMEEYIFSSLQSRFGAKLQRGYQLNYFGKLKRIGMYQHVWQVVVHGERAELLGSLSVANDRVVGFSLD